jgi:peptide subunit release factor 1 (eRF1)
MSESEIEQFYQEREEQYRTLNVREHVDGERYIVDCSGCGQPMILGDGWMGCKIPDCPDCNETADSWTDDPRIPEHRAETLAGGEANIRELVRS